jgi:hypothetical protein
MFISMPDVKEAERLSKVQRIQAGRWLRVDESKITAPKDMMLLHRVRAAAAEQSTAFDSMLSNMDVNRLFNDGALYFERFGQ